jgi:hypothetical protein
MEFGDLLRVVPPEVTTANHLLDRLQDRESHDVLAPLAALFPRQCLERGAVYHCRGQAALSLASALVAPITHANGWVGFVDVDNLNMHAMADLGVSLRRVVSVQSNTDVSDAQKTHALGVLVEGCDVVVAQSPKCTTAGARSVATRAKRHNTTLVLLGRHSFSVDVTVSARITDWIFVDRLQSRLLNITLHDQRTHYTASTNVVFPDSNGALSLAI